MKHLDPELAAAVPLLPTGGLEDPAAARATFRALIASMAFEIPTDRLRIDDRSIPGRDGAPDVAVRVYEPRHAPRPAPGLLYLHGGGFVLGDLNSEHAGAANLAALLGIVVVSVDYRLAPEHPFPAGLDDCYAALRWTADHAAELEIDLDRLGVAGSSAGGGLSAAVALLARDRGGPRLCFQFLGIPDLDDRLDTPSMREFVDTPLWSRPQAELSWRYYLGEDPGAVSPYAAPARAENLRDLPPAYVSVCEYDPLRDEGIAYASRLLQAGVSVELHHFPGTFHGSAMITNAAVSRRQSAEMVDAIRRGLGA